MIFYKNNKVVAIHPTLDDGVMQWAIDNLDFDTCSF